MIEVLYTLGSLLASGVKNLWDDCSNMAQAKDAKEKGFSYYMRNLRYYDSRNGREIDVRQLGFDTTFSWSGSAGGYGVTGYNVNGQAIYFFPSTKELWMKNDSVFVDINTGEFVYNISAHKRDEERKKLLKHLKNYLIRVL